MKLIIDRLMYAAPAISIIPETDYEAAVLSRYWDKATLSTVRAHTEHRSANGFCYSIRLVDEKKEKCVKCGTKFSCDCGGAK